MMLRLCLLASICAWACSMYLSDPTNWERHPYLVKVLTKDSNLKNISTCTGALLSPSVVLTSAKCFPETEGNLDGQAIILKKGTKDMYHKAMLAFKVEGDMALMKIDAIVEDNFCDKFPYPSRVSRLNFKPSLLDATYQSIVPKDLQDTRCRIVGFSTNEDVEKFATSRQIEVSEIEVRADDGNLMFSEVNRNTTGRACWDDIGAPLECTLNEEDKWVQVGFIHSLYGRGNNEETENENESNSTIALTCSDVQTMQFVVFGDNTFAHNLESVDKVSVFEAQEKCF